jgi:aspartyl/asparaginyl beta-hydroxylase (cupin superfamily)
MENRLEHAADLAAGRGDVAEAERLLSEVVAASPHSVEAWIKLASMRRARGNVAGALEAVSRALTLDPLHFMALMSRARLLEASGEHAEAARFYMRALGQLPEGQPIPATLAGIVAHATRMGEAYRTTLSERWGRIAAGGEPLLPDEARRVARFTSNALRSTRVYHSEPTHYHYPGLAEREFHDRATFPWLARLEAETDTIREEFLALQHRASARSEPYVQYAPDMPVRQWAALNHSLDWTAFHLMQGGHVVDENAAACPQTMAALQEIDQPRVAGRSPNAMFSLLKPRTRIPPHVGIANTRLVCHLPLIVPDQCWFRVGAERREWRVGEAFVFDDTIEHEAANDSDAPRVVLIVDLWHPDLAPAERTAVKRLMEADASGDGAPL